MDNEESIKASLDEFVIKLEKAAPDKVVRNKAYDKAEYSMNEFIKLSSEKIKNGTFNKENINNIKNTIFPYLTEEQKKSFYSIISQVTNE